MRFTAFIIYAAFTAVIIAVTTIPIAFVCPVHTHANSLRSNGIFIPFYACIIEDVL